MTNSKFCGFLCDVFCVVFAISSLYLAVVSVLSNINAEKPNPNASGSGFHLLSCPHLFEQQSSGETNQKYSDIHLNAVSTEKLMTMLRSSLQHAHVLHAGSEAHKKSSSSSVVTAVEERLGADKQIDVNIPRKGDNAHLCDTLKQIIDEQIEDEENDPTLEPGQHVTISIMKLSDEDDSKNKRDSLLLRGAKKLQTISDGPVMDHVVMKLTNLDDKLRKAITAVKQSDAFQVAKDAAKLA